MTSLPEAFLSKVDIKDDVRWRIKVCVESVLVPVETISVEIVIKANSVSVLFVGKDILVL